MRADPLMGSFYKVGNGKMHIDRCNSACAGLAKDCFKSLTFDVERDPRFIYVSCPPFRDTDHPTPTLAAADAVQNFRIALEYLVYALIRLPGGKRVESFDPVTGKRRHRSDTTSGFPICECRPDFDRALADGMLDGMNVRHAAWIECFQPYNRYKFPSATVDSSILLALRALSNADKHKLLQLTTPVIHVRGHWGTTSFRLSAAAKGRARFPHPDTKSKVRSRKASPTPPFDPYRYFQVYGGMSICFSDAPDPSMTVQDTVLCMGGAVGAIVTAFIGEF